ncbi:MAG: TlpA family protein disulfide reductase [Spirochaetaceae bacterium]|jgi:thiol-disulfide isomerase/thioredoxin|nr:TlpA family protein disulfide reductase [Spirochaetaceae bacterium]GMO15584.1 MAG: hypothetical protein Pg6A_01750 [Termitinemataceae bacterium]
MKYFNFLFLSCTLISQTNCTGNDYSKIPEDIKEAFSKAGVPLLNESRKPAQWTLKTIKGETISLESLRGKIVFLNFWATWCPPCRGEMPSMEALYQRFKTKDFAMVACNIMEDAGIVQHFAENGKYNFTIALDSDGKVSENYGVQGIPASYVIDREGNLILQSIGGRNWDTPGLRSAFEALLNYGQ